MVDASASPHQRTAASADNILEIAHAIVATFAHGIHARESASAELESALVVWRSTLRHAGASPARWEAVRQVVPGCR